MNKNAEIKLNLSKSEHWTPWRHHTRLWLDGHFGARGWPNNDNN